MKSRNPNFQDYVNFKISRNKFMHFIGFEIDTIEAGRIEGHLNFEDHHKQQNDFLHGGLSATLLDVVSGFAAYSLVEEGAQVFTVEAKVNYYKPGIGEVFYAHGRVDKPGRLFHFCQSEIFYLKDGQKVIVAKGNTTMAVVSKDHVSTNG